jgi:hypothetical protein
MITLLRPANKEPGRRYGDKAVPGVSSIQHLGNDYGWGSGWQVYAAASGRVSVVHWSSSRAANNRSGGYGNYIIIDHGDGYQTLYAHLPTTVPWVAVGDFVVVHQQIGLMGNTGNASGPHLHFEVRHNGSIIDPNPLIGGAVSASSSTTKIEEGFLMALSDDEQAELLTKTRAVFDALFLETPTSRGTSAGVLRTLAGLERQAEIQYDVAFKTTSVTLADGTVLPGGVLKSLAK